MQHTVLYNQTLADITLQATGDLEQWFAVALLNGLGITDAIEAGEEMLSPEPDGNKRALAFRLQARDNRPATGDAYNESAVMGGIGYMQIGNDFIVS